MAKGSNAKGHGSIYDGCPFTAIDIVPSNGNSTAKMHGGECHSGGAGMEELNMQNPYGLPNNHDAINGRPRMWQPKVTPVGHEDYEG